MKIIQNYRNEIVSNGIFYHFLDEHIRKDWGYHVRQNIEFLESHNIFQNRNSNISCKLYSKTSSKLEALAIL